MAGCLQLFPPLLDIFGHILDIKKKTKNKNNIEIKKIKIKMNLKLIKKILNKRWK